MGQSRNAQTIRGRSPLEEIRYLFFTASKLIHWFVSVSLQKGKKSASNFDPEFTKEAVKLSPVENAVVAAIEPEVFDGFSFTNPEYFVSS